MTSIIRRLAERTAAFFFDLRNAYYEFGGKPVSTDDVLTVVDRRIQDAKGLFRNINNTLIAGDMGTATWAESLAVELRRGHTQSYALGRGGWERMTAADRAAVTARLREEYKFLRDFARDVQSGKLSEAQIRARADMYAEHLKSSYWAGQTASKREAGFTEERRHMRGAHHCKDCPGYADRWEPIGSLPEPGDDCECRSRCKCEKEYR